MVEESAGKGLPPYFSPSRPRDGGLEEEPSPRCFQRRRPSGRSSGNRESPSTHLPPRGASRVGATAIPFGAAVDVFPPLSPPLPSRSPSTPLAGAKFIVSHFSPSPRCLAFIATHIFCEEDKMRLDAPDAFRCHRVADQYADASTHPRGFGKIEASQEENQIRDLNANREH